MKFLQNFQITMFFFDKVKVMVICWDISQKSSTDITENTANSSKDKCSKLLKVSGTCFTSICRLFQYIVYISVEYWTVSWVLTPIMSLLILYRTILMRHYIHVYLYKQQLNCYIKKPIIYKREVWRWFKCDNVKVVKVLQYHS